MNKVLRVIALTTIIFLNGCVSNNTKKVVDLPPEVQIFQVSVTEIWPIVFSEISNKYPMGTVDKDNGLLTTDFYSVPKRKARVGDFSHFFATTKWDVDDYEKWAYCPDSSKLWSQLRVKLNIIVTEIDDAQTKVSVKAYYEALKQDKDKVEWVNSNSNGNLERSILENIGNKL